MSETIPEVRRFAPAHAKKAGPHMRSSQRRQSFSPPSLSVFFRRPPSLRSIFKQVHLQCFWSHMTLSSQHASQAAVSPIRASKHRSTAARPRKDRSAQLVAVSVSVSRVSL